eukprot:TRINITY_DN2013_c0_g1_i2.p1 TRINITY_DN2013_c0_g1~~TRINITY_DN2013_c0_g1_i2.p1  ORF type:complete len:787 (+),score=160.71 TRINITY_DN2013_c0_g1_i2:2016-4376(+)
MFRIRNHRIEQHCSGTTHISRTMATHWETLPSTSEPIEKLAIATRDMIWAKSKTGSMLQFDPKRAKWDRIVEARANDIAIDKDGDVLACASEMIFRWKQLSRGWDTLPGLLKQISYAGGKTIAGITEKQDPVLITGSITKALPGKALSMHIDHDGVVHCVRENGLHRLVGSEWKFLLSGIRQFHAANSRNMIALTEDGSILLFGPDGRPTVTLDQKATHVSIACDGTIVAVDNSGCVLRSSLKQLNIVVQQLLAQQAQAAEVRRFNHDLTSQLQQVKTALQAADRQREMDLVAMQQEREDMRSRLSAAEGQHSQRMQEVLTQLRQAQQQLAASEREKQATVQSIEARQSQAYLELLSRFDELNQIYQQASQESLGREQGQRESMQHRLEETRQLERRLENAQASYAAAEKELNDWRQRYQDNTAATVSWPIKQTRQAPLDLATPTMKLRSELLAVDDAPSSPGNHISEQVTATLKQIDLSMRNDGPRTLQTAMDKLVLQTGHATDWQAVLRGALAPMINTAIRHPDYLDRVAGVQAKLKQARQDLENERNRHATLTNPLEKSNSLRKQATLAQALSTAMDTAKKQYFDIASEYTNHAQLTSLLEGLRGSISGLEVQQASWQQQQSAARQQVQRLNANVTKLDHVYKQELEECERKTKETRFRLQELKRKHDELTLQLRAVTNDAALVIAQKQELRCQKTALQQAHDTIKLECTTLQDRVTENEALCNSNAQACNLSHGMNHNQPPQNELTQNRDSSRSDAPIQCAFRRVPASDERMRYRMEQLTAF